MPSNEARRKAIRAYKEREEVGGLYKYVNTETGWESAVMATPNLEGQQNRLQFAQKTGVPFDNAMREQWNASGPNAMAFVTVEKLAKKPEQTPAEFREELAALLKLWTEDANEKGR